MAHQYSIEGEAALPEVAATVLAQYAEARVFAIEGPMGAGKTTLIKAFCKLLGVTDPTASPTYAIVHEYQTKSSEVVYHMDLYRLENIAEAHNIGIEEYIYSGAYVFVEWPQLIAAWLPEDTVQCTLAVKGPTSRTLTTAQYGK